MICLPRPAPAPALLQLHSMNAQRTQPGMALFSDSTTGGIAVDGVAGSGGVGFAQLGAASRQRLLVEQPHQSRLSALAAAAGDLVFSRSRAQTPAAAADANIVEPPSPVPEAWLEGGTMGQWPKPYRNKTRQVPWL